MKMLQFGWRLETSPTRSCAQACRALTNAFFVCPALQPLARSIAVAPGVHCVKALVLVAMLLGGTQFAVAEDAALPPPKPIKARHSAPLQLVPPHPPRTPPRAAATTAVPEQFSPSRELRFLPRPGSRRDGQRPGNAVGLPDTVGETAVLKTLPMLVGAGECGAVDAVVLDSIILADKTKVAVSPPATLRCSMAEAVAIWLRRCGARRAQAPSAAPRPRQF